MQAVVNEGRGREAVAECPDNRKGKGARKGKSSSSKSQILGATTVETCRCEGDDVVAAGAHCDGSGSVQPKAAADAPREKVSAGGSETWDERGYRGNVLVRNALGHMPRVEHGAVLALTPREIRSRENDECVGGLRNPTRWVARTPSAQRWVFPHPRLTTTATRNRPGPCHRAPWVRAFLLQFVHSARHRKKVALQVNNDPTPRACGIDANLWCNDRRRWDPTVLGDS